MNYTELEQYGSYGEEVAPDDLETLSIDEQERSLARAHRWELQIEFIDIPDQNSTAMSKRMTREKETFKVSEEDEKRLKTLLEEVRSKKV